MQSLALTVQESLKRDPHAGDLYIFRGRRGDLVKILWHDGLATFRRKIDVSGIEVSWLPQNKTRRGERRARVGLD
jgi:hypothetical protein